MCDYDMYTCGSFETVVRSDGYYFPITSDDTVIATLRRPYGFLKSGMPDDGKWQVIMPDGSYLKTTGFYGIDSALQGLRHHRHEQTCRVVRRTLP